MSRSSAFRTNSAFASALFALSLTVPSGAKTGRASLKTQAVIQHEDAELRRKQFVGAVGGLALLVGVAGLVILRRQRRREAIADASRTERAPATAGDTQQLVCPTCRAEYPQDTKFCNADGNRLVAQTAGTGQVPLGGICPICGQGFDPGVAMCPVHHEALVPVAVYRAEQPGLADQRICPTCGTQYLGNARFCGQDGSKLVPLN